MSGYLARSQSDGVLANLQLTLQSESSANATVTSALYMYYSASCSNNGSVAVGSWWTSSSG